MQASVSMSLQYLACSSGSGSLMYPTLGKFSFNSTKAIWFRFLRVIKCREFTFSYRGRNRTECYRAYNNGSTDRIVLEPNQVEEEQASSELTSDTQQSSGNGREQDAVDETLGMADDQPRANIVTADRPDTMPEVDVSYGCSAWMSKAIRGFFE